MKAVKCHHMLWQDREGCVRCVGAGLLEEAGDWGWRRQPCGGLRGGEIGRVKRHKGQHTPGMRQLWTAMEP